MSKSPMVLANEEQMLRFAILLVVKDTCFRNKIWRLCLMYVQSRSFDAGFSSDVESKRENITEMFSSSMWLILVLSNKILTL